MKKTILLALALLTSSSSVLAGSYAPTDGERARWTMSDMTSWRTALEAYAKDHRAYPAAANIDELRKALEGKYMAVAPVHDAWGRAYRWERTGDGFRLVSSGADGSFDEASWSQKGIAKSLDDDAVMTSESGWLTRFWSLQ
ncbi:MAG TPA: type II secretion system protein GspG [Thermoanaerobaculia bacterium]